MTRYSLLAAVLTAAFATGACVSKTLAPAVAKPAAAAPVDTVQTTIRLEAEAGQLFGVRTDLGRAGFSGNGYVTGFDRRRDRIEFRFDAAAGLYEIRIGYASPRGVKRYELRVNSDLGAGHFTHSDEFAEHAAGKFLLSRGQNQIVLDKGWGYFDIDYIELRPTKPMAPVKPPNDLSNIQATKESRALFSYLIEQYGRATLAGQQDLRDIEYVRSVTGREPAVGVFDLMDYSPSRRERGADPKGLVEQTLAWASRRPAVVSLSWHWNAPTSLLDRKPGKEWWRGFYTKATSFDVKAALGDTASDEYRLLIRDLDAIADELRKYQQAKVPILWRPLHEAAGGWFWWGAKGAETFVRLWRLMFDRYVNHHGLHHLIWVYSPPDRAIEEVDWYPGDEYVDIVGVDVYTKATSSMSGQWDALQRLYGGRKLVALTESGTPPDPEKTRRSAVRWSWFSIWSGKFIRKADKALLKAAYLDRDVITRDELPDLSLYDRPSM